MLLRLLAARLGSVDEAEDALHDLWLKLDTVTGGPIAEPIGYLCRMASNIAVDRRRRAARRTDRDTGWLQAQAGAGEQPDAERALIARERLDRVERTLAGLPDRVATAFRLYRFEDLPQKVIAERMGISISGVEKLLHRAYRRIHMQRPVSGGEKPQAGRLGSEEGQRDGR
ncbi:sigma-70 family RNA polymerase sigma factor [Sphingomonas ginsenosidivorax]|uniref:Sigma-70 family RNA polymerase sigma factor n=2 Tax=Sphingomonas ginsenosidivorax TaxID=862135 RepID=A0A5C6UPT7_9SPHN|nr:sigma-70 family RNA polymerase sigma factor [Sphingomonas ginsenosidivorax]